MSGFETLVAGIFELGGRFGWWLWRRGASPGIWSGAVFLAPADTILRAEVMFFGVECLLGMDTAPASPEFMPPVSNFRELDVYQLAVREAAAVFRTTDSFPPNERYALSDQLRRSSSAVAPLIAEAWPRRRYKRAFTNTLRIAAGEVCETQAWLHHAQQRGYITHEAYADLLDRWEHVNAMLYSMIGKADQFAGGRRR